jgi:hypothetical protein
MSVQRLDGRPPFRARSRQSTASHTCRTSAVPTTVPGARPGATKASPLQYASAVVKLIRPHYTRIAESRGATALAKDLLSRLAEELLHNQTVGHALGTAMRKGLETKGRIDRNVQTILQLLNLPTRADLARLQTKLDVIQGSLVNLSLKVDRLLADRDQNGRRLPRKRPVDETAD